MRIESDGDKPCFSFLRSNLNFRNNRVRALAIGPGSFEKLTKTNKGQNLFISLRNLDCEIKTKLKVWEIGMNFLADLRKWMN